MKRVEIGGLKASHKVAGLVHEARRLGVDYAFMEDPARTLAGQGRKKIGKFGPAVPFVDRLEEKVKMAQNLTLEERENLSEYKFTYNRKLKTAERKKLKNLREQIQSGGFTDDITPDTETPFAIGAIAPTPNGEKSFIDRFSIGDEIDLHNLKGDIKNGVRNEGEYAPNEHTIFISPTELTTQSSNPDVLKRDQEERGKEVSLRVDLILKEMNTGLTISPATEDEWITMRVANDTFNIYDENPKDNKLTSISEIIDLEASKINFPDSPQKS